MEDDTHEHSYKDEYEQGGLSGWFEDIFVPHSHDSQQTELDAAMATERHPGG